MSIALKTALIRLGRATLYGAISAGLSYLIPHIGEFNVPVVAIPIVTAVLLAADKWFRENVKPEQDPLP